MADTMSFPQTIEEFMEQYKVVDTEQVYSNGAEFVPIFRVKQWLEHLPNPKDIFYDGYAYCLMDFGKDTVLCKDCKHYKQSAVVDRKMCFRKDVDGIEVCYDFQPYDSCTYGERKDEVEEWQIEK